jgi:hypothetical protein
MLRNIPQLVIVMHVLATGGYLLPMTITGLCVRSATILKAISIHIYVIECNFKQMLTHLLRGAFPHQTGEGPMKRLLLTATVLMGLAMPANAAIVGSLGLNPTSATGAFHNAVGGATFADQYTFELVGGPQFLTIGSATNNFAEPSDFITGFNGSVFQQVGEIGGGDDILVLGPDFATLNCGLACQGFGGAATLEAGTYYLQIAGVGGGTSGYGGTLSTAAVGAVPEPSTWAMMLLGFVGLGYMGMRRRQLA